MGNVSCLGLSELLPLSCEGFLFEVDRDKLPGRLQLQPQATADEDGDDDEQGSASREAAAAGAADDEQMRSARRFTQAEPSPEIRNKESQPTALASSGDRGIGRSLAASPWIHHNPWRFSNNDPFISTSSSLLMIERDHAAVCCAASATSRVA